MHMDTRKAITEAVVFWLCFKVFFHWLNKVTAKYILEIHIRLAGKLDKK